MFTSALTNVVPTNAMFRSMTMLFGGQVVVALAGLGVGKAVAVYVPPAELGAYNLLLSGLNLAHVMLIVPILQAFKADQGRVGAGVAFHQYRRYLGWVYGVGSGLLLVGGYVTGQFMLSLLICLAGIGQGLYGGSTDYLNLLGRQRLYIGFQVGYALVSLALVSLLVIAWKQDSALGLWGCLAVANTTFALITVSVSARLTAPSPLAERAAALTWQTFRRYASPLVALALWGWVINYGDRYLIRLYLTEADVGQYSVGYGLGAKLVILVSPFVAHSTRHVYRLRANNALLGAVWTAQKRYLVVYAVLAGVTCAGYYGLRNQLGLLLLSPAYGPAFQIGPIIATGYLFLTLIHLLEVQWYAYGFTKLILWTTLIGAVANVSLNVLLIPRYGLSGAATASLLGFFIQFIAACCFYRSRLRQPVSPSVTPPSPA